MSSDTINQLIQVLSKTVSPDHNELTSALAYLEQLALSNLPEFMKALSDVLAGVNNPQVPRMAAGLQLKNTLTSKDTAMKAEYQKRWLSLPEDVRNYVKKNVVSALGTETSRPSAAAQCVAYIAVAELPVNQWPDLIRLLVTNVTSSNSTEMLREATLEAIGYICQDIDPDILAAQSNEILTAIVHGMKKHEKNEHVKLAATTALLNSLEFTRANFEKENERNYIMQVVCEATQSPNTKIKVSALQCLVKIMSLYYRYMEAYMGPALFAISLEAMKSDIDEIALQGIEFWSNVCDEEIDLVVEAQEAEEMGRTPERTSRYYALGALQYILPVLLHLLTKQEDSDDDEDWNPCKAAGVCLMLLAQCCGDNVVGPVLNFVKENIKSPNWRCRDAAVMAFGSVLEGPNVENLQPIVEQALPILIELSRDPNVTIRDTTAWTLGKICEITPDAVNANIIPQLLDALIQGLKTEPRVAHNICWALNSLASSIYEKALQDASGEDETVYTYALSPYFPVVLERLLETTERPDANQNNLRTAAYEALMEFIKSSPKDCYIHVARATEIIITRLNQVLQMEGSINNMTDRSHYFDLQSLLCATLQSVLKKMTKEDAMRIGDAVMQSLLHIFNSSMRLGSGAVQEDAMMAVASLAEVLGEDFLKYMDAFKPFLYVGIKNVTDSAVCRAAIGIISDICRAMHAKVIPYCNDIMSALVESLNNVNANALLKPEILTVFGDIALAIGAEFRIYLEVVLTTLYQASQAKVDRSDYDNIEYLNRLRESCVETYASIVQGLREEMGAPTPTFQMLYAHVPFIVEFLASIAQDPDRVDSLIHVAAGLVGDLCNVFGSGAANALDIPPIQELLGECRRSKNTKIKSTAHWATKELKKSKSAVPASWSVID
ncbi:hypothetical protein QYM36_002833 [Artemia franciscana]|uniref:Importin N-terminal domain-containing protein n=2 Tax=Artemia franciscana TaxID=6661 RepID=A0AA88LF82_ARTSF|nr:hypothetical protein QYM36_002833 [Artemia franciscana]